MSNTQPDTTDTDVSPADDRRAIRRAVRETVQAAADAPTRREVIETVMATTDASEAAVSFEIDELARHGFLAVDDGEVRVR